jgi:hypothetical protein
MLAWHFTDGWKLRDGQPLEVGKTYVFDGKPVMCWCGYHASEKILDALRYAPGTVVSRVECDEITDTNDDKFVCKRRTVLWSMDIEMLLHEFACRCAEHALKRYGGDDRSWAAIEVKRKWIRGEATDEELSASRVAAQDAARAAWDAAQDAAWSAAQEAARSAALDAAWDAAQDAARAAGDSALVAARVAAWDAQNRLLTAMVTKAHKEGNYELVR